MKYIMDRIVDHIEDDIANQVKDRIIGYEVEPDEPLKDIFGESFGSVMREFSIGEAEQIYLMVYTRLVDDHRTPKRKKWWEGLGVTLYRACLGRRIKRRHFERDDVRNGYQDSEELIETCLEILNGMEKGTSAGWPLHDIAAEYIAAHPLNGYSKEMQARVYSIALQAQAVGEFAADYGEYVYEKAATWGKMDIVPQMVQTEVGDYLLGSIYRFTENKEYKEKGCKKTAYEILKEEGLEIEMKTDEEVEGETMGAPPPNPRSRD